MSAITASLIAVFCTLVIGAIVFYKVVVTQEWRNRAPNEAESWYALFFYYNPKDERYLLPHRSGLGWTINFARPVAVMIAVLAFAIFIALVFALKSAGG